MECILFPLKAIHCSHVAAYPVIHRKCSEAGDLSRTVAKLLPDVFAPISTIILVSRLPAASASLNTEPILKRVVPMNRTHTYTWGNRAQVEKYRSYPLTYHACLWIVGGSRRT